MPVNKPKNTFSVTFAVKRDCMNKPDNELSHSDVFREGSISDYHYYNEVEYEIALEELHHNFGFITALDDYYEEIPIDTPERYEVFKKSTAQFYCLNLIRDYKDLTLRTNNNIIVKGLLDEIKKLEDDPRNNKENPDYASRFIKAIKLINTMSDLRNEKLVYEYSAEEIKSFLYILHKEEYFKLFPIPEDAFDIKISTNRLDLIGEVYGKYFLFKEYLEKVNDTLENKNVEETKPNKTHKKNKEYRKISEILNEDFKEKFTGIINILSKEKPFYNIIRELSSVEKVHFKKNKMAAFDPSFIEKHEDNVIYFNGNKTNLDTFLCYLFAYLFFNHWIMSDIKITDYKRIIDNSLFNNEKNNFFDVPRSSLNKYINDYRANNIESDNQYVILVKQIISNT